MHLWNLASHNMSFQAQNILVTGASSGIGAATAIRLAAAGARLVLVGRDADRLQQTLTALVGTGHLSYQCDLTDEIAVIDLLKTIKTEISELHGMAHCAGNHWLKPLQLTDSASLREMMDSHVGSSISLARGLISSRLAPKTGCAIVWISSVAALQGGAGSLAYAAAKGAMISAMRVLAVELARRKIRINIVIPGVVQTPQSAAFLSQLTPEQVESIAKEHLLGLGEPDDVAAAIQFLLSADARWITGTTLVVDGGLSCH
jgi:NAD(P)-dependent dehydrogenase (short-subunit alcohol dehydrogenase family)